ncbi:MAG TPA: GDSL-type esterase/lipase family protein [Solirubrobacterales bacterium]|nr:GDSL-type esterase/lipase family protein [Solirubrobacterales bacterium]
MGDSYSSGEGAGDFDFGTRDHVGNGCHRSRHAWPRLLGVSSGAHLACSGATTEHFVIPQKRGLRAGADHIAQLARLQGIAATEPISRVFVTIGGNDLGFSSIIKHCFLGNCMRDMDNHELKKLREEVVPKVTTTLVAVRQLSGGADVILVGYPDLIPPASRKLIKCNWLSDQEKPRVRRIEAELDSALAGAAAAAGVAFLSIRSALSRHELCTKDSWLVPIGKGNPLATGQGHPNVAGQHAIAQTVGRATDTGAGIVPPPPAGCVAAGNIAAIVDDSGSMEDSDPLRIRAAAMQLLITKPGGQDRTLGAVEFGTEAGPLFAPGLIGTAAPSMLAALSYLEDDGFGGGDVQTDYNAAFEASADAQPAADARIFLTDGLHNQGLYEDLHRGGPRTYVVGLDIGPAGAGSEDADLLRRIAIETGGAYFPLQRNSGDSFDVQTMRLQPVFAAIDSLLECKGAPTQSVRTLQKANAKSAPVASAFLGSPGIEVVLSWTVPGTVARVVGASVRNANGGVVANLTGKPVKKRRPHGKRPKRRKPAKLATSTVEGTTFQTTTITRPPRGATLSLQIAAPQLSAPTEVSIQVTPVSTLPTGVGGAPVISVPASAPAPPAPPRRVITVDNRVTNGGGMREDSTPARLTTQPWILCGSRGCNINGTERSSGGTYDAAVCQTSGERTTNGNDHDASDDANPERFESTRYYGVRLADGTFGYVSEVWIRAADRGGLGLPGC